MSIYIRTCVVFLTVGLLTSCATRGLPTDPNVQGAWFVNRAAEQVKLNNYGEAFVMLVNAAMRPKGPDSVKEYLVKSPEVEPKIIETMTSAISGMNEKKSLIETMKSADVFVKYGVLLRAKELTQQLDARAVATNTNGEIAWDLSDETNLFPSLQNDIAKELMFFRTLKLIQSPVRNSTAVKSLAEYILSGKCAKSNISVAEQVLSNAVLRKQELQSIENIFPKLASEKYASLTAYIKISVSPSDRLLEEDIKEKVASLSQNFVLLKQDDPITKNTFVVSIERHRF